MKSVVPNSLGCGDGAAIIVPNSLGVNSNA